MELFVGPSADNNLLISIIPSAQRRGPHHQIVYCRAAGSGEAWRDSSGGADAAVGGKSYFNACNWVREGRLGNLRSRIFSLRTRSSLRPREGRETRQAPCSGIGVSVAFLVMMK